MTQERVAYVNGEIVPESRASVSISDRGFILGDRGVRHDPHVRARDFQARRAH